MEVVNRICCVCRNKQDKSQMTRLVYINNTILIDNNKKYNGKGCYVCSNPDCRLKLIQKKILNRVYRCNIDQQLYEKLSKEM
jgi:predicted RNA-binding protein YlxR (DUF448 family)